MGNSACCRKDSADLKLEAGGEHPANTGEASGNRAHHVEDNVVETVVCCTSDPATGATLATSDSTAAVATAFSKAEHSHGSVAAAAHDVNLDVHCPAEVSQNQTSPPLSPKSNRSGVSTVLSIYDEPFSDDNLEIYRHDDPAYPVFSGDPSLSQMPKETDDMYIADLAIVPSLCTEPSSCDGSKVEHRAGADRRNRQGCHTEDELSSLRVESKASQGSTILPEEDHASVLSVEDAAPSWGSAEEPTGSVGAIEEVNEWDAQDRQLSILQLKKRLSFEHAEAKRKVEADRRTKNKKVEELVKIDPSKSGPLKNRTTSQEDSARQKAEEARRDLEKARYLAAKETQGPIKPSVPQKAK